MKALTTHNYRRTTLVAVFCVAVLLGLGLARNVHFAGWWLAVAVVSLLGFVHRRGWLSLMAVVVAGCCLGGLRGSVMHDKLAAYDVLYGHRVTIVGAADSDATYGKNTQLVFDVSGAHVADSGRALPGTIGGGGFGENMIFRGDTVMLSGTLRPGSGSHQAWLTYAQIRVVRHNNSWLENIRRRFNAGMLSALPEPLGSFGMGLLIGGHSDLPSAVYQDLLMVGLVHIIAVSGYNLTIILRASQRLTGKRSTYQTLALALGLIGMFLLFTGFSASIVRAAIVSGLSLLAWYYGRSFKPLVLIGLAAAVTGLANPLYVWGDMGWYLSFLAFFGVMVGAPLIKSRLVPERWHEALLVNVALESLCAEIMTIPVVLYVFGQMSFVSLPANLVIATFVPLAMLTSLVAGLAGMLLLPVAGWLAWPAVILLTYMLDMAHLLAHLPHIFIQNVALPLAVMLGLYAIIGFCVIALHWRLKRNRAIITVVQDENQPLGISNIPRAEAAHM